MSIFTKVLTPKVKKARHNLSYENKMTLDMGQVVPMCLFDVVPGDQVSINVQTFLRMLPLISPVMHSIKVKIDFFEIPNRLLWPNWEKWIRNDYVSPSTPPPPPTIRNLNNIKKSTLGDYLGYPQGDANNTTYEVSAFPIAAYFLVHDWYYRDQNLQPELFEELIDGPNDNYSALAADFPLKRAWGKDYVTSALPWAQKGDAVKIPLLGGLVELDPDFNQNRQIHVDSTQTGIPSGNIDTDASSGQQTNNTDSWLDPNGTLRVEEEQSTIENLRRGYTLQRFLETNARAGTRITEWIYAHFDTRTDDLRHMKPKYLGGTTSKMIISEVLATAETEGTANVPVGNMAGHGINVDGGKVFQCNIKEHGWIMGLVTVIPKTAYSQGVPKMFLRKTYLDYLIPSFANLGEQEITNAELYVGNELPDNLDKIFGYIPRYAEYKFRNSEVHGDFKVGESLAFWTLSREFVNAPALNEEFIQCDPGKRIFAVTDPQENSIVGQFFNNISIVRPLPKYAIPMP